MASQALYRKWRSQRFDEIIGQQHVTQTLVNALLLDRVAHAYLFSGPRGTGKTSSARLLAKAVNCKEPDLAARPCNRCNICLAVNEGRLLDLIEIDAASNTGVDDMRDLRDKVNFRPGEAAVKFYIIDEVHMLSNSAFNALLKTLEEPPSHVIFVLATTEPEKIPATITSRCQRFDFKRIKQADISGRLAYIVEQEGLNAEQNALEYIARQGGGSMRDAISLLDQMTAYGDEVITLELVKTVLGAVTSQAVVVLVDALIEGDIAAGLDAINQMVADGADARQLTREIVEYLRAVMLMKLGSAADGMNFPDESLKIIKAQADKADTAMIVQATARFNAALFDTKSGLLAVPQLPLELAVIETITPVSQPVKVAVPAKQVLPVAPKKPPPPLMSIDNEEMPVKDGQKLTVEMVENCFGRALRAIEKKNKVMAETLRNNTHLVRVLDNKIYFSAPKNLKERFEKPQPSSALNDAFSKAVGQSVTVHFLSEESVQTAKKKS